MRNCRRTSHKKSHRSGIMIHYIVKIPLWQVEIHPSSKAIHVVAFIRLTHIQDKSN